MWKKPVFRKKEGSDRQRGEDGAVFQLRRLPWKRILAASGIAAAAALLLFSGMVLRLIATAPDIDTITVSPSESATYICDADGNYLRKLTLASSNRDIVSLAEIPDALQQAVIAIEDERFYSHSGIDPRGIARAFWTGITSGSFSEGASTITQQLIKNSVFTEWTQEDSFRDRFKRKIQEQYLALQLEKRISKEEILEDYLNTINLGSGCYGVQAAARRYFGKDVSELTLSEAAVLAAIPQNPSGYNPIAYPEANRRRRETVLYYMKKQGYISAEEQNEALADDVYARIHDYNSMYEESAYSYYEDALIDQVTDVLVQEKGYSPEQAYRAVYSGGLRIFSAQDPEIQKICDEEFQNPANFPEGTEFGIDYALSVADADGTAAHYGSEALRSYIRETQNETFNLLCTSQEEAQAYADAFREHILEEGAAGKDEENDRKDGTDEDGEDNGTENTSQDGEKSTNKNGESIGEESPVKDEEKSTNKNGENTGEEGAGKDGEDNSENNTLTVLGERLTLSPQPQASLVLIDQKTGYVRALVGGRGEKTASLTLNRATETTRQPGSTFKILTAYAPALDADGQTLATTYENEPYQYEDGTPVSNWDITDYSGTVTIREAITRSINVIAVKCLTKISPRLGFQYAQNFGISTLHEYYESENGSSSDVIQPLALGGITQGVTNLELCGAYAAIANGGVYRAPKFFTKILDRQGNVLADNTQQSEVDDDTGLRASADNAGLHVSAEDSGLYVSADDSGLHVSGDDSGLHMSTDDSGLHVSADDTSLHVSAKDTDLRASAEDIRARAIEDAASGAAQRVLSEDAAFLLTDVMRDVVADPSGTAYGAIHAAGQPVSGKTGTTSNYKDIWFVGYTPYYTCCVWGGYDNNQDLPLFSTCHTYSKDLWSAVMDRIHDGLPTADFVKPDTVQAVTLCRNSHRPAVPGGCTDTYEEYFAGGTVPQKECPLHEAPPETERSPILFYPGLLDGTHGVIPEAESESETKTTAEANDGHTNQGKQKDKLQTHSEETQTSSEALHDETLSDGNTNSSNSNSNIYNNVQSSDHLNNGNLGNGNLNSENLSDNSGNGSLGSGNSHNGSSSSGDSGGNNSNNGNLSNNLNSSNSGSDYLSNSDSGNENSNNNLENNFNQPDTSSLDDLMNRLTGITG